MGNDQNQNSSCHNKAIASMVLGIIGVICVVSEYTSIVGIAVAIVGLVLGIQVQKTAPEGMAKAGVILCAVALGLSVITLIACVACAGFVGILGIMSL